MVILGMKWAAFRFSIEISMARAHDQVYMTAFNKGHQVFLSLVSIDALLYALSPCVSTSFAV